MTEELSPRPPRRVRGRPFEKGRSGNPLGRRVGCRNKTTITAPSLLAGEADCSDDPGAAAGMNGVGPG